MNKSIILLIRFYKYVISPLLPAACRFVPTCSEYASEAIQTHGIIKGGRLAVWRLLRCHPFCKNCDQFTHDPVPKKF